MRMVREAIYRIKKYAAKVDPDAVRIRFDKYKDDMVTQQQTRLSELSELQTKVRNILNEEGISPAFTMPYMACANELYRLKSSFSGKVFENEAKITLDKWYTRGCNSTVLVEIAKLFGITWSAPGGGG